MPVQPMDGRTPVALADPSDIKPGDWMHDLGTLRQVDTIDTIGTVHVVHFRYQEGVPHLARGICSGVDVTVWRARHVQA